MKVSAVTLQVWFLSWSGDCVYPTVIQAKKVRLFEPPFFVCVPGSKRFRFEEENQSGDCRRSAAEARVGAAQNNCDEPVSPVHVHQSGIVLNSANTAILHRSAKRWQLGNFLSFLKTSKTFCLGTGRSVQENGETTPGAVPRNRHTDADRSLAVSQGQTNISSSGFAAGTVTRVCVCFSTSA